MSKHDLGIIYEEGLSLDAFQEFVDSIRSNDLDIALEEREPSGPFAGIEWLMITGIAVFIGSSYFDGFLKEVGKDHYTKLKSALSRLTNQVMSTPRIEPVILGSPGKVKDNDPYSMALSVYAEANDGRRFKLLLPKPNSNADYTKIIHAFLEFLNDFHLGVLILSDIGFDESARHRDRIILVHWNSEIARIEWLNPIQ